MPAGALISYLQKGLQYLEIETHLLEDGTERPCDEPFRLTAPHICRVRPSKKGEGDSASAASGVSGSTSAAVEIPPSDATLLRGHKSEVFAVSFNPVKTDVLASGSGDGLARVWQYDGRSGGVGGDVPSIALEHGQAGALGQDVSSLDWTSDGTRLLTGCYDCRGRIFAADGTLQHVLMGHTSQIMSVQWSPGGQYALTGSVDKTAIVWDASSGGAVGVFAFHSAPILDVDWASDSIFATSSSDKLVHVCALGERAPTRTLSGHTDEVNAIAWGHDGTTLASASDDCTARLWRGTGGSSSKDTYCLATLSGHKKQVYTVKWAPTGEGSRNASSAPLLATASFDATVRLWDPATGKSVHTLVKHTTMVNAIAFSPDGAYLASGSADRNVHIWNVRTGALTRTYTAPASVFDISFNAHGDRLAVACANSAVAVVEVRM